MAQYRGPDGKIVSRAEATLKDGTIKKGYTARVTGGIDPARIVVDDNVKYQEEIEPMAVGVLTAARILGVGKTVTYELIKKGLLRTVHIGGRHMVRMSSIKELVGE